MVQHLMKQHVLEASMTQQKASFEFFNPEKLFGGALEYPKAPVNIQEALEIQRKNLSCLSEAQQLTAESIQTIVSKQVEFFSQFLEEQSHLTSELLREGKPEDKINKNAELIKASYERALTNAKEISDLVRKTNTQTTGLLNKRASASIKEIRESLGKAASA